MAIKEITCTSQGPCVILASLIDRSVVCKETHDAAYSRQD
jgi:hypothetical protein